MTNQFPSPEIKNISEKKMIGKRLTMSLVQNKTMELWKSFMPERKKIEQSIDSLLYSIQLYSPAHFTPFNPSNEFEKWATVEVADNSEVPEGMEAFTLPGGRYAVFLYKGLSTDPSIFQYIFGSWLPASDFQLDHRPHFEVLGEKYKNGDPESEEEIWIPVKENVHCRIRR